MTKPLSSSIVSILVVGALSAFAAGANAQADDPPSALHARHPALTAQAQPGNGVQPNLGAGSFSAYCIYHYAGTHVNIRCNDWRITANSRVVASLSEYSYVGPESGRFMGNARLTTHNVVPFNGGVDIWTDVEWGSALNIRLDLFVDP